MQFMKRKKLKILNFINQSKFYFIMESIKNQIENSQSLIAGANKDILQKSKAELDAIAKKERIANNAKKKAEEKEALNKKNAKDAKKGAEKESKKESIKMLHFIPNRNELSKDELKALRGKRRRERDSKAFKLSNAFSNGKDFKEQLKDFIAFLKNDYPSYANCKNESEFLSCLSNKLYKNDFELKAEEKNQKHHLQIAFKAMQKAKESRAKDKELKA